MSTASKSSLSRCVADTALGYTSNSNANWNGAEVVRRSGYNIVLVNFNYRVGMWGFLAGDWVRRNGTLNVGLLDQRLLLQWVKQHIDKVGRIGICCLRLDRPDIASSLVRRRPRPRCHPWRLGRCRERGLANDGIRGPR